MTILCTSFLIQIKPSRSFDLTFFSMFIIIPSIRYPSLITFFYRRNYHLRDWTRLNISFRHFQIKDSKNKFLKLELHHNHVQTYTTLLAGLSLITQHYLHVLLSFQRCANFYKSILPVASRALTNSVENFRLDLIYVLRRKPTLWRDSINARTAVFRRTDYKLKRTCHIECNFNISITWLRDHSGTIMLKLANKFIRSSLRRNNFVST